MRLLKITFFVTLFIASSGCKQESNTLSTKNDIASSASSLISAMTEAMGGVDGYRKLKDVTYSLVYRDTIEKVQDVSIEKYIYDGELSLATYTEHTKNVFPKSSNPVTQAWNGKEAWVIADGNFIPAEPAKRMAKFARNTAFFWFNMMYKMADEGTVHKQLPDRLFQGTDYSIVEVTYDDNVGDAQDKFLLYINPETNLVDHFIFSNNFMGPDVPPRMMHVTYEEYNGLKFPKKMAYEMSDWEGNLIPGPMRAEKLFSNVRFNTGIKPDLFEKPLLENIPMADIRNARLRKGITKTDEEKGRQLLDAYAKAIGGFKIWNGHSRAIFTQTADWYDNETNWTTNPQEFKMTVNLGGSNGSLQLLNGPLKDEQWNIKEGVVYLKNGKIDSKSQDMVWHKQNYKSYWFQFPFKIQEAEIVAFGGQKIFNGKTYDIVYATWHSEEPNSKYDQFMLYLDSETHLLEWLEFTIRDIFSMVAASAQFKNYKLVDGLNLPMSQYIYQGKLDQPGKKIHENHYQTVAFE